MTAIPPSTSEPRPGHSKLGRGLAALIDADKHRPRTAVETYMLRGFEALLGVSPLPAARKPRKPTLASLLKQAADAGRDVKGAEIYPDRTVLQFGDPESAKPENPWPPDEFRLKEIKR